MEEEMGTLNKNNKWDLVHFCEGHKRIEKHKGRIVAKDYYQVVEIDYGEIFYLVIEITSIIFLPSLVKAYDLEVE
jgi:hypothetical protein